MTQLDTMTAEGLTSKAFALISTAQRNGLAPASAVEAGIRPFMEELVSIRQELAHMRTTDAVQDRQSLLENLAAVQKDKERLDWIEFCGARLHPLPSEPECIVPWCCNPPAEYFGKGATLREAIDNAMSVEATPEDEAA